jgi:predicted Zn-dependent peptidase
VLGGGSSGRLFVALRDQLGATYGAYSRLSDIDRVTQALLISTAVANDSVSKVIATIKAEYARFLEHGVTEAELEETKTRSLTNLRANIDSAGTMATTLRWVALRGNYPTNYYPENYERHVRGITRAQVNAEILASFPRILTIVVVAPSAAGLNADCVIKSLDEIARCE